MATTLPAVLRRLSCAVRRALSMALLPMLVLCPNVHAAASDAGTTSPTTTGQAASHHSIVVQDAWVRWLPGTLPSAGYMTLTNTSARAVTVVGAASPDYGDVMLHQTVHKNDHDVMTAVASLRIPAGGTVRAAPEAADGYHWMLTQATHPITVGAYVSLQLRLDDGSTIVVPMIVSPPTRVH